jgi:hypothetical protein
VEWANAGLTNLDRGHTLEMLQAKLTTEIACAAAPFIVAAIAYWVYRAFKPRP